MKSIEIVLVILDLGATYALRSGDWRLGATYAVFLMTPDLLVECKRCGPCLICVNRHVLGTTPIRTEICTIFSAARCDIPQENRVGPAFSRRQR